MKKSSNITNNTSNLTFYTPIVIFVVLFGCHQDKNIKRGNKNAEFNYYCDFFIVNDSCIRCGNLQGRGDVKNEKASYYIAGCIVDNGFCYNGFGIESFL